VVCLSHLVSPAKTAEPIETSFGFGTRVDPGNHALHGSPNPRTDRGNFEGGGASHCKVYGLSGNI